MSVRQRSKLPSFRRSFASAMDEALVTARPIFISVSSSSSRMSGSSSTTSTWWSRGPPRRSTRLMPCESRSRLGASRHHPEMRPRALAYKFQARAVGGAELARQIQAQAGPLAVGGEEGLEQLPLARRRHAGAVVDDAQFYAI